MQFQPLIRYVGGKRKQSEDIIARMPTKIGTCYIPFLGSGAVMFQLINSNIKFDKIIASDIYQPLMYIWDMVQKCPNELMWRYEDMYNGICDGGEEFYNTAVERFNSGEDKDPKNIGATFFFLTRACIRGNLEYDKDGNFITKCQKLRVGDRNAITSLDTLAPIINRWNQAIQDVEFRCESYEETLNYISKGDFVFLDPPYIDGTWYHDHNIDWDYFFSLIGKFPCDWGMTLNGDRDVYQIPECTEYTNHEYIYYGVKKSASGRPTGSRDSYWTKQTSDYEYDDTRKRNIRQNERGQGGSIAQINDIRLLGDINEKMARIDEKLNYLTKLCERILELKDCIAYEKFTDKNSKEEEKNEDY